MKSRLGCFLVLVVAALLWAGGQNVYTALRNPSPTVISAADFAKTRPGAHWLRLTDCRLSMVDAMCRENHGKIEELYIPVRPPQDLGTIHVLLATKDLGLLAMYQDIQNCKDAADILKVYTRHGDKIKQRQTVEGLVRFGIDLKDKDSKKMASLEKSLAPDFVILDDGKKPNLLLGIGFLAPGLLIGGFAAFKATRS